MPGEVLELGDRERRLLMDAAIELESWRWEQFSRAFG